MLLSIFCSMVFFRSAITMATSPPSYVNQSSFVLAQDHAAQRAGLEDAEHRDRQLLVAAQRQRRRIHHPQVARDRLVEADLRIALGARVALRIGGIHTVDLGRLDHDFRAHLAAAQRGGGVGGKERVAGAGGEDHHLALLQVADRLAPDVRLDHLLDIERRLHAAGDSRLAHRVGQRERIHHGGQHSHVVGGGAVHAGRARRHAAENVAAADHHAELHPEARDLRHLAHDRLDGLAVDAVRVVAHQGLAGQLEQNALVFRSRQWTLAPGFSMPSPTTRKAYACTRAFFAASIFSTVCLSSLMNGWPSRLISPRNLFSAPSTIFDAMASGLPDSLARASWIERSRSTVSAGTSALVRCAGLAKAMCIATSLPASSGPS